MSDTAVVYLPRPLAHQGPALNAEQRHKLLPWGRRTGKSRTALVAAMAGHGPKDEHGLPKWKGVMHGYDVVWLAPDFTQARIIWDEEVEPRFKGNPGFETNENEHTVTAPGGGKLIIASCENPTAVRGSGARLIGVVLDEFAHVPVNKSDGNDRGKRVWLSIVRPALMDNGGWSIWPSSPKRGSFFNKVALQIMRGHKSRPPEDWYISSMDARSNRRIRPEEFLGLVEEYEDDPEELAEEVYGEVMEGGAGTAFPSFNYHVHRVAHQPAFPPNVRYAAGLDWGTAKRHCYFCLVAFFPERRKRVVFERLSGDEDAYTSGRETMRALVDEGWPVPEFVVADEQMWHDGKAVGLTVAGEYLRGMRDELGALGAPVMLKAPHKGGSRAIRKSQLTGELRYTVTELEDGRQVVRPWHLPLITFSERCPEIMRCIEKLPRDERHPDDVDTKAWDHPYDGLTYLLVHDIPWVEDRPDPNSRADEAAFARDNRSRGPLGKPGDPRPEQREYPWERGRAAVAQAEQPGGYRTPRDFEAY